MSKLTRTDISRKLTPKAAESVLDFILENLDKENPESEEVKLNANEVIVFLLAKSLSYESSTETILTAIKELHVAMLTEFGEVKSQLTEIENDLDNVYELVDAVKRQFQITVIPKDEQPELF